MSRNMIISFPHMGDYYVPIKALFERLLPHAEVCPPPPITKETSALGERYSPDFICEPFKYNIGNYIQALQNGANVLLQTGIGCRFGYYGELQEEILRSLGYEFDYLCLSRTRARPMTAYESLKALGSPMNGAQMLHALAVATENIRAMDKIARFIRENAAFSQNPPDMHNAYTCFLRELAKASAIPKIHTLTKSYYKQLQKIPITMPEKPLRVGIIGDLYTVMEPFSNCHVEERMIKRGIAVSRKMDVSFLLFGAPDRAALRQTKGYLRYPLGANGLDSVAGALRYARRGYDGVVHLKSFGCTPELNAMPALMKISADYEMPILHMSFDTHSVETGVETRLEAFMDMIEMRRGNDYYERKLQPGS